MFPTVATEFTAAIQVHACFREGKIMSRDRGLDELSDVRIPISLHRSLDEMMAKLRSRILRDASRRALENSAKSDCILSRDDISESIHSAFREGPSEWLTDFVPFESS